MAKQLSDKFKMSFICTYQQSSGNTFTISGHCPKSDVVTEQRHCVLRPCPQWTEWSSWSECLSCNKSEKRQRARQCEVGIIRSGEPDLECSGIFKNFFFIL